VLGVLDDAVIGAGEQREKPGRRARSVTERRLDESCGLKVQAELFHRGDG
jgi:hypothetical protein